MLDSQNLFGYMDQFWEDLKKISSKDNAWVDQEYHYSFVPLTWNYAIICHSISWQIH